jgi:hypothetical protein
MLGQVRRAGMREQARGVRAVVAVFGEVPPLALDCQQAVVEGDLHVAGLDAGELAVTS